MTVDPRHLTGWRPVVIDEDTDNHGRVFRQWIVRDDTNTEVCKVFYVTEDGEAQAQLIGAAPAMLAALRRAERLIVERPDSAGRRPVLDAVRAAIALTEVTHAVQT